MSEPSKAFETATITFEVPAGSGRRLKELFDQGHLPVILGHPVVTVKQITEPEDESSLAVPRR